MVIMKGPLLLLVVLGALGAAISAQEKPIAVGVGQEFTVTLESRQSPDYQWVLASPLDEKLLRHCGREYKRANPRVAGACGSEVLTFRAMAEGRTEIRLKYGRVWESAAGSARNTNFVVLISKGAPQPAR
jgi:predicted secreted protein